MLNKIRTNFPHRYLINFGVFQMATATMTSFGTTPAHKGVTGTVRFFQNPFIASDNSRFTIEIVGLPVDTDYWVCLIKEITASPTAEGHIGADTDADGPVVNIST